MDKIVNVDVVLQPLNWIIVGLVAAGGGLLWFYITGGQPPPPFNLFSSHMGGEGTNISRALVGAP